jgi:hypothetical protein
MSSGREQTAKDATALCCGCGHDISCEVRCQEERLGFLAFFDDKLMSSTYSGRVKHCPVVVKG